ncbi:MAG: radical SAM protein [Acidobacteria bacterium]|nr:radical SAM protein [Acidobacteriota bacterium]
MEYAYRYGDPDRLYLNGTNRCTNRCSFCIRYHARGLGGSVLWGGPEPDLNALQDAVLSCGAPEDFNEFIWCGFGEPTYRLDIITEAADWLHRGGATVRLNTNGHACLIHGRDVLAELAAAVDAVSVSLNAPNCQRYVELCLPDPGSVSGNEVKSPEDFWESTIDFLARAPEYFKEVQASVVGFTLSTEEIEETRILAHSIGIERFRVR